MKAGTHIEFKFPAPSTLYVKRAGGLVRRWTTEYRGPVAFIGEGRVWCVAQLVDVKAGQSINAKYERVKDEQGSATGERIEVHPEVPRFFWCFTDFQDVEGVTCAQYRSRPGLDAGQWESPRGDEPSALNSGAQAELDAFLASRAQDEASASSEYEQEPSPVRPSTRTIVLGAPKLPIVQPWETTIVEVSKEVPVPQSLSQPSSAPDLESLPPSESKPTPAAEPPEAELQEDSQASDTQSLGPGTQLSMF